MRPTLTPENMPPQRQTISLEEAKQRCANWRDEFMKMVPTANVKQIPKAIFFHWADIEQIVRDYKPTYAINGIRIYFDMIDVGGEYQIRGVMVPTIAGDSPGQAIDLVIPVPIVVKPGTDGLGDEDEGVSIYDMSRPCPSFCDPESPLP